MDGLTQAAVSVMLAIVGLATVAVLVSRSANTSGVISAGSTGFVNSLNAAVSPVTGGGGFGNYGGGLTGVGAPIG